ncbi:MAG: hypothetical protein LAN63_05755 [Acidobacteriia bacterium]|nr:hypothetical protein [Terriglobia bacterium]
MESRGWILLFLAVASCPLWAEGRPQGCQPALKSWRTYIDRPHGFCFQHPATYKRVHTEFDKKQVVTLQREQPDGKIYVVFEDKPFDLQGFVAAAPTGYDSPPEPFQAGPNTFYYYGPGGGGVAYADQFFYELKGKTLYITFDGPYEGDNTPTPQTKQLERKILGSFHTF